MCRLRLRKEMYDKVLLRNPSKIVRKTTKYKLIKTNDKYFLHCLSSFNVKEVSKDYISSSSMVMYDTVHFNYTCDKLFD